MNADLSSPGLTPTPTLQSHRRHMLGTSGLFVLLLAAFGAEAWKLGLARGMGAAFLPALLCFALLLAPLWFFAFGAAEPLLAGLRSRIARIVAPAVLALPYLLYAIPLHEFHLRYALALALLPVALSALLEFAPRAQKLLWQDVVVLLVLAFTLELGLFSGAWPRPGLGSLPKLYLADVALYLYLIVRDIDGMGYSFRPQASAFAIGLREFFFYAPFAFAFGFATHFIGFHPRSHSLWHIAAAVLVTFLLTAVPEEIFFRCILQNLLEPIAGRGRALAIASVLFGLAHFHKGAVFNWRYVIMAAMAGVFYGRAWRAKRQILASAVTHTAVDVVWSLWFR
jgi:membrane protease YdiL (CAAX protease family)